MKSNRKILKTVSLLLASAMLTVSPLSAFASDGTQATTEPMIQAEEYQEPEIQVQQNAGDEDEQFISAIQSEEAETETVKNTSVETVGETVPEEVSDPIDDIAKIEQNVDEVNALTDSIQMVLETAGELENTDISQTEELHQEIEEIKEAITELPAEAQDALQGSLESLSNADESVKTYQNTLEQIENGEAVVIEQTGMANSFRYINGEKIDEAVVNAQEEAALAAEAVKQATIDEIAEQKEEQPAEQIQENSEPVPEETTEYIADPNVQPESTDTEAIENLFEEANEVAQETDVQEVAEEAAAPQEELIFSVAAEDEDSEDSESIESTSESTVPEQTITVDQSNIQAELVSMQLGQSSAVLLSNSKVRHGIDVSFWQSAINWEQAKANGVEFAILRCGYGDDLTSQDDKQWARNVSECERLGIPYGVYLYSYATNTTRIDSEVAHTLRLLKGHNPQLPVYLDIEESSMYALGNATLSSLADRYCGKIKAAGYNAGVYSSLSWWNSVLKTFAQNNKYFNWIAQWNTTCTYSGRYEMWQDGAVKQGAFNGFGVGWDSDYWYGNFPNESQATPTPTPAPKVTVTFNANGGSGSMTAQSMNKNTSTALSANTFTRNGYTFTGWNTAANGSGTKYSDKQAVSLNANITLYAQWANNKITVTYNANGGSGSMTAQTINKNTSTALSANAFTRTGYVFDSWNTAANGSGTKYSNKQAVTLNSNITLYAQWKADKITVTFNANGGSGSMTAQSMSKNTSTALSANAFTRSGYTFNGWNTSSSGTGTAYKDKQSVSLSSNITLYAQWKANPQQQTSYNTNITANDIVAVMQSWLGYSEANGKFRQIIDLYNSYTPLAKGYKVSYYDEWCDATVSAAFIKCNAVPMIGGTECGVQRHIEEKFIPAGIWIEDGTITPQRGDIITFSWRKSTQPNNAYGDHIGIVESVNGTTITTIEGNYGEAVTRRTIPVGYGYIRGYARPKYAQSQQSQPTQSITAEEIDRIAREVLAAKWGNGAERIKKLTAAGYDADVIQKRVNEIIKEDTPITITFNANGGSGTTAAQSVRKNTNVSLNNNGFSRSGYAFDGWNTAANGSGTKYSNKQTVSFNANVTLYAQWKPLARTGTASASDISGNGSVFRATLSNLQNMQTGDTITFAIWSEKNGQDDLKWINGTKSGANYYADAQIKNFRTDGRYQVHVYAKDSSGKMTMITSTTFNVNPNSITYRAHCQSYGWMGYVSNGGVAGTTGQSKRMEAINISVSDLPYSGGVQYRVHCQTYGWRNWVSNGALAGTTGESKRLEAVQIKLTGELAKQYDVYYQAHVQHFGWTGWAKNGANCGSAGYSYRMEALKIKLVPKNGAAPGSTANTFFQK